MTTRIADAQNFLDINGLNSIRQDAKTGDSAGKKEALEQAAKQFEAIFMQMLMKSMRKAQAVLEADSPLNSESTKFYRDMHDQQMSLELSNNGALGLAPLIVRQLGGDTENFTPHTILRSDGNLDSRGSVRISEPSLISANSLVKDSSADQDPSKDRQTNGSIAAQAANMLQSPTFTEPKDFVSALTADAKRVQDKINVPFEVVIAQAALETGWGQKIIKTNTGESSNNLFNIKADSRWAGDKITKDTLEFEQGAMIKKSEPFRTYQSLTDSVDDYINFLSTSERYQDALQDSGNVEHFLQGLQKAGYATDPQYADKILGTLKTVTNLLAK